MIGNFKILGICMNGFKGFKEETIYRLPSLQTIIAGRNCQGKSSIGDAICWGLYGTDINMSDKDKELVNDQSEEMYVTVEIEVEGEVKRVTRIKKNAITLKIDGVRTTQKALNELLPDKNLFMTIFNPNLFLSKTPSKAREQLISILPKIQPETILNQYNALDKIDIINKYPSVNDGINVISKEITNMKNSIKYKDGEIDTIKSLIEETKLKPTENVVYDIEIDKKIAELNSKIGEIKSNKPIFIDEKDIKNDIRNIELSVEQENNKVFNDTNASNISVFENEVSNLRGQYTILKTQLDKLYSTGPVCKECGQSIDESFKKKQENEMKSQMLTIKEEINQYTDTIKLMQEISKENRQVFQENKQIVINGLLDKIEPLKEQLKNVNNINKEIDIEHKQNIIEVVKVLQSELNANIELQTNNKRIALENEMKAKNISEYTNKLDKLLDEKNTFIKLVNKLEIEKSVLVQYNSEFVTYLTEILKLWLNRVNIELFKVNSTTGEVKDDFKVYFDDKPYNRLSNSEKVRVALEISNMFNMALNTSYPTFVDNAECILELPIINTQMLIAKVVDSEITLKPYEHVEPKGINNSDKKILLDSDSDHVRDIIIEDEIPRKRRGIKKSKDVILNDNFVEQTIMDF